MKNEINLTHDANYNIKHFRWNLTKVMQYFEEKYTGNILVLNADKNKLFFKVDSKYYTIDRQNNIEELSEIKDITNFYSKHVMLTDEAKFGIQYFNWDLESIIDYFNKKYGDRIVIITDADLHRVFYTVDNKNYEMDVDGDIEEV